MCIINAVNHLLSYFNNVHSFLPICCAPGKQTILFPHFPPSSFDKAIKFVSQASREFLALSRSVAVLSAKHKKVTSRVASLSSKTLVYIPLDTLSPPALVLFSPSSLPGFHTVFLRLHRGYFQTIRDKYREVVRRDIDLFSPKNLYRDTNMEII